MHVEEQINKGRRSAYTCHMHTCCMHALLHIHTHSHSRTQITSTPANEKALFEAARKGDKTTVVALLKAGTNPNNFSDEVCVCVCVCLRACVCDRHPSCGNRVP